MAIKDWHADDQPREKLLKYGAESLSDAEVLAIFLRMGTKDMSAIDLARSLIDKFGSLAELLSAPPSQILDCHGIGTAKYAQIMASLEMGKRYLDSQLKTGRPLNSSELVKKYLATQLRQETTGSQHKEVFALLCLDNSLMLLDYEVLFVGGISSCGVGIKEILRHAISHSASNLIVAHNHPNANILPSTADTELTVELFMACQLIGVNLLDHVIVSRNEVLSYAEQQLMPFD